MQWYSYSKTGDFDKPRFVVHRRDVECGGFEYEYCFAEYEYRFAEYDTNRKHQSLESFFSHSMQFAKRKLRVFPHLIPRPLRLPWEVKGSYDYMGIRFFLLLCVSHAIPSHGHRGPCYGVDVW